MTPAAVLIITGPTASGKSDLALELARKTGGEIVSADSRQIFKHMDIGTAKLPASLRKEIPHHCMDLLNPDAPFSAGEYAALARAAVEDILARKRLPIVVGGSGLYIQALVDGFFPGDYRDASVRARLRQEAEDSGSRSLYQRLQFADPDAASGIHPNDLKRIIRALEVIETAGKPVSQIRRDETLPAAFRSGFWGLDWPREYLYARINDRVDRMIREGLEQEVRGLLNRGYSPGLNSMDSPGYREMFDFLAGRISPAEAVDLIKRNTRRFAKRQMTWFRRDPRIRWIRPSVPPEWPHIAEQILLEYNT
ncbi:tRNA (adenosine(37)-N6)-dimethylallyltransferase MiaA [bacterium]|nr:tRNA (adenosine(37)-N6)-dimethylallyltransferase MiaA [bacterium]